MKTVKIGSLIINITHPEKVLFPDDGITKGDLVDYYHRMASVMVPHIKGRPVNMYRLHGSIQEGYYQQEIPAGAPAWVDRVEVKKEGGTVIHVVCDNASALVYLANQNCVTLHTWLSRTDKLETPDQMIFDLDPPGDDFEPVRQGAGLLKSLLDEIGIRPYLKTTGSRGLHIVVPLDRTQSFEEVRSFAHQVASIMTSRAPEKYTTEQRKEKRNGRLFIDTLRNSYGHTAVAPYSVRALKGAPVATPLFWEELKEKNLTSLRYNIRNIFKRLEQNGDAWKEMERPSSSLKASLASLEEALKDSKS
jgi:bifunctional non-homologous end joining protein LigD